MPMLPSGRHVALKADGLIRLIEDTYRGLRVHELMVIETPAHLYPHIDVCYFRTNTDGVAVLHVVSEQSRTPPSGLEMYPSGYTLKTIEKELSNWSTADRIAFECFVHSSRNDHYLDTLLAEVTRHKQQILDHGGASLSRLLALWWQAGVHPLQTEGEED